MVNKVKDGKTLTWTATEAVGAGGLVSYCGKIGIAQAAIASGDDGVLDLEGGVYNFPITVAGAVTRCACLSSQWQNSLFKRFGSDRDQ